MKLKAVLTIDIDAADAYDARAIRERLTELTRKLQAEYADARLEIRPRRTRTSRRAPAPSKLETGYELVRLKLQA